MIRYEMVDGGVKICGSGSFVLYEDHISELEKEKERADKLESALDLTTGALEGSQGVVREFEERIKELEKHHLEDHNLIDEWHHKWHEINKFLRGKESKIKDLEAQLASIKADPLVECGCDHDGEFDAGQKHCRKCEGYLF